MRAGDKKKKSKIPITQIVLCLGVLAWWNLTYNQPDVATTGVSSMAQTPVDGISSPPQKTYLEMTTEEQKQAMQVVLPYMKAHADLIKNNQRAKWNIHREQECDVIEIGTEWGAHKLCNLPPKHNERCHFVSFGISHDYSFDMDLSTKWNCRGFAADPTVDHPSHLNKRVTFHNMAAKLLNSNSQQKNHDATADSASEWWVTSVPSLKKFLGIDHINVLKMDCEGCEYSLPRDVLVEEPNFWDSVDQLSLETHVSKAWMEDREALYYFALLFKQLHDAGFKLQASLISNCSKRHERQGCLPELEEMGYPCGFRLSCHDALFAKV